MAGFSSDASYKQNSPSKASILGELHEAQRTIRRLEEKLQKMEVQQARPSPSIHDEHHKPSTRASSNDFGREDEHRRRRTPPQVHGQRHHHQGERQHYDNGFYQDAKSRLPSSSFLVLMALVILMYI